MAKNWGSIAQGSSRFAGYTAAAATGAATAFSATLEEADYDVYKDGSATQRSSTAGFTAANSFDSLTGGYGITIDFSDNTDAGFYAAGADVEVWLSPDETLDSVTILAIVAYGVIESEADEAVRLYRESVFPLGATIATTTGNTTGRILLTDLLDAQTADGSLVGANLAVWDATNGQVEHVTIVSVESARLFNVVCTSDGAVMDFTVAAGDRVWFTGFSALRATVPGRTLDTTATGAAGIDWGNVENATTVVVLSGTTLHGVIKGTAATGTLSTTVATSDLSGYANDELNGRVIIFTGGTAEGQAAAITDYASASGTVTFSGGVATAPADGDTFVIV